jgi:hypothetical protein
MSIETDNNEYNIFSFTASIVIHSVLLVTCIFIINKQDDSFSAKGIDVQISAGTNLSALPGFSHNIPAPPEENTNSKELKNKKNPTKNAVTSGEQLTSGNSGKRIEPQLLPSGYYNFAGTGTDTTGLVQVYSEKTLNVKIKYPMGWIFVDQDRKNKLDGVTFWANNDIFNPPPYIFLEVKEKYLFNPSRYKYITELKNSSAYYNDPEELEGQVSQVFYIRTSSDEDYSIKLIMNSKDTFIAFQPVFFSMIKSFNFGSSLF